MPSRNSGRGGRPRKNIRPNTWPGSSVEAAQEIGHRQPLAARTLQLGEHQPALPAGDAMPVSSTARIVPGAAGSPAGTACAAPELHGLAVERAVGAGERIEGADAPLDGVGRLGPVDLRLVPFRSCGVGDAFGGLRHGSSRRKRQFQRFDDHPAAAQRGQACRAARRCVVAADVHALRSSMSPVSRPASICMMVMPVSASPASMARWIGAAPRQRGSRRGVDVQAAQARQVQHPLRQDQPVGGDHHHVGLRPFAGRRADGGFVGVLAIQAQAARLRHRPWRRRTA
jgi:hypothetical protein